MDRRQMVSATGTRPRRKVSQTAERSLSGRRLSPVFWIAGGTYACRRTSLNTVKNSRE
jgi:hypothetical protein